MNIDSNYRKAMLFNLKVKDYIYNGDTSVLKKAKAVGDITRDDDEYKIINKSIIESLKKIGEDNDFNNLKLLFDTIKALGFDDSELIKDRIRLRRATNKEDLEDVVTDVLSKDYGEKVAKPDVFMFYSQVIQQTILIQNDDLIQKAIEVLENIEKKER